MTNLKINVSTQNVTAVNNIAISHSRNASGTNIDEEGNDDEILRERLVKLIYDSFNIKGVSPSTTLDYYRLVKMIGKGAFGKVYLGVHLLTGKEVAIKSIEKACMKDEASKRKVF
jgi:serine/threonine protein kinase